MSQLGFGFRLNEIHPQMFFTLDYQSRTEIRRTDPTAMAMYIEGKVKRRVSAISDERHIKTPAADQRSYAVAQSQTKITVPQLMERK